MGTIITLSNDKCVAGTRVIAIIMAIVLVTPLAGSIRNAHAMVSPCNCVIFRLDDIQGGWLRDAQIAVLDTFIKTHTKVTTALIMDSYGNSTAVVEKVKQGQDAGLFELALHGWDHDKYGTKSLSDQEVALSAANAKLTRLNGVHSDIFVAPYNAINRDTLKVMKQLGLPILSASYSDSDGFVPVSFPLVDNATGVVSVPFTVNFVDERRPLGSNGWTVPQLTHQIDDSIAKHGFAVVLMHPQDVTLIDNGNVVTSRINSTKMDTLGGLIAELHAEGKQITDFNDLTGIDYHPKPIAVVTAQQHTLQQQQPTPIVDTPVQRSDDDDASQVVRSAGIKTPAQAVVSPVGIGPVVILAAVGVVILVVVVVVVASTAMHRTRHSKDNEDRKKQES